jgi:hypothetical protein
MSFDKFVNTNTRCRALDGDRNIRWRQLIDHLVTRDFLKKQVDKSPQNEEEINLCASSVGRLRGSSDPNRLAQELLGYTIM